MARMKPQALLLQSKKKKVPSRISVTTILFYVVFVVFVVFILYSTYNHWSSYNRYRLGSDSLVSDAKVDGSSLNSDKLKFPLYAVLSTTKGSISVELFKDSSSEALKRFIDLSQSGHFNGKQFLLVVKHAAIIAGNADKSSAATDFITSGQLHGQLNSIRPEAFMVGTSKETNHHRGFGLFITTSSNPELKEKLHIFGQVVKGQDVVQKIEDLATDDHYKPSEHVEISNVALKEKI